MDRLSMSVQYIKGVGPKRASKLRRLNIHTVEDLIYFFPRSYEDRSKFSKINDCVEGQKYSLKVQIVSNPTVLRPRRNLSILKIPVKDDTGMAYLVWFNQDYLADSFNVGESLTVNGRIKRIGNEIQITNPVYERESAKKGKVGRIIPIYPLTEKLSNNEMTKIINNAIKDNLDAIEEVLPIDILKEFDLMPIKEAILNIHFPVDGDKFYEARRRLVFEELLILQLGLFLINNTNKSDNSGIKFQKALEVEEFVKDLPYKLTGAQKRVFKEIEEDMESDRQMNRLVQGDVGSGKTVIAVLAMIKAWKSGYQSVMMAPTEILATQHYESVCQMLRSFNIKSELLVGSLNSKKRKKY